MLHQISKHSEIERQIVEIIAPVVESLGYELWDIAWVKEQHILRIFISQSEWQRPITHVDCRQVSRAVDTQIEEQALLGNGYNMEVSSLGPTPCVRTWKQLTNFIDVPLELVDGLGRKITGTVFRVQEDGQVQWSPKGVSGVCSVNHISEFQRIRVKQVGMGKQ